MAGASNQTATRDEPGGTVVQLIRRIRAWSWLANFGRFKLFAASYVVLIILPLLCALADDYNRAIDAVTEWSDKQLAGDIAAAEHRPGDQPLPTTERPGLPRLFKKMKLQHYLVSWKMWASFVSAILLSIGGIVYALFCPREIKQYSLEQWKLARRQACPILTDAASESGGRGIERHFNAVDDGSEAEYRSWDRSHRAARSVCCSGYLLGALLAGVVVLAQFGIVWHFVWTWVYPS